MDELKYDKIKKKLLKIQKAKGEARNNNSMALMEAKAKLEEMYPDLIRLAELFCMTRNTVVPEGVEINGIKCFFSESFYSFSLKTDDTWEYAAGIIMKVDLERQEGVICSIDIIDPPFGYAAQKEITLANLMNQFTEAYPAYEEEMMKRIEKWIKEQRKLIREDRF